MTAQARWLGQVHTGAVLEMVGALRPALCCGPEEGRVSAPFLSLNAELSGTAGLQGAKDPAFRVVCLPLLGFQEAPEFRCSAYLSSRNGLHISEGVIQYHLPVECLWFARRCSRLLGYNRKQSRQTLL